MEQGRLPEGQRELSGDARRAGLTGLHSPAGGFRALDELDRPAESVFRMHEASACSRDPVPWGSVDERPLGFAVVDRGLHVVDPVRHVVD